MDKNDNIGMRLKLLRSRLNMTQIKLSEVLSCSQSKVSDMESGKLDISNSDMSIIANSYNVKTTWLLTGRGSMFLSDDTELERSVARMIQLPVVGDIAAGFPVEVVENEPTEYVEVGSAMLSLPPPYFVFRVDGESMQPVIMPGDYVVLSTDWRGVDLDGKICAFRDADGITLKQYVLDPAHRTAWLWPINSSYSPIPYTEDSPELTLIGVLILSIRKY